MHAFMERLLRLGKLDRPISGSTGRGLGKLDCEVPILSSLLPYLSFDPEKELFYNQKSQGFILALSPLMGASDETVKLLSDLLTTHLTPKMHAQFLLWADPRIGPYLEGFALARQGNSPLTQQLALARKTYLAEGATHSLSRQGSVILRDFQLYFVVSLLHDAEAEAALLRTKAGVMASLRSLAIPYQILSATPFLNLLQGLLWPESEGAAQWEDEVLLRAQLQDTEMQCRVLPEYCEVSNGRVAREIQAFTVKQFPREMTQAWMNESIGRLCDPGNALQIPCPFILSLHVKCFEREHSRRQAEFQWLQKDRQIKSPLAKFMPTLSEAHAEWCEVRQRVQEGERLVHTYFQALILAPKGQRLEAGSTLKDLFRANGWQLKCERYLQLPAYLAVLPMLLSEGLYRDLKLLGRMRTMTATQAVNIAPLQGEWKGMSAPCLLLPGRRGQVAFWDPFAHHESNYNVAIAASSGRGKSAFTQEYIVAQLARGAKIWVIDVGRSYEKTCELLGGQFIAFNPEQAFSLNPFSHIQDLNTSLALLKPLFAAMARPSGQVPDEENSYLEKAIKAAWELQGQAAEVTTVADWLAEQENATCQTLAHLLYPYTREGMYGVYFNGRCDFSPDNALTVLELEELKAKKDLQKIILLVLMYHIAEQMYLGERQQQKSCIIDEAWDLLAEETPAAAHFIETGFRRARRYNANFITITQSINDYFKHATALAAFENAFWKIILGQEAESIAQLKQQGKFTLDAFGEQLLKSLRKTEDYAECLIKAGSALSVHRILFDPFSRVLYSSKGEEYAAVKAAQAEGLSLEAAIAKVAKKYVRH